uniref:Uncharacterized protein n=1 Tax=Micrurus paraensis TaxID=1970185 RepID=A0A2D4JTD0_9SAUR
MSQEATYHHPASPQIKILQTVHTIKQTPPLNWCTKEPSLEWGDNICKSTPLSPEDEKQSAKFAVCMKLKEFQYIFYLQLRRFKCLSTKCFIYYIKLCRNISR